MKPPTKKQQAAARAQARREARAARLARLPLLVAEALEACKMPAGIGSWGYYQSRDWKAEAGRLERSARAKRPDDKRLLSLLDHVRKIASAKPMEYSPNE